MSFNSVSNLKYPNTGANSTFSFYTCIADDLSVMTMHKSGIYAVACNRQDLQSPINFYNLQFVTSLHCNYLELQSMNAI